MREYLKNFIICIFIGLFTTYLAGWLDLYNNKWITGNLFQDFWKSITYYFGWVFIYWWLFILIGSLTLALLSSGSEILIKKRGMTISNYKRILINLILFTIFILIIWLNRKT